MKTMNNMKKFASILLALVMVLAMAVPAMAATITVATGDTHTYTVYQIFTGDLHEGVLSNIKWGKNGTGTEGQLVNADVLSALTGVNGKSNAEKLAVITQYVKLDSTAYATDLSASKQLEQVPNGYYLIKDTATITGKDAYTTYIVEIVSDVEITRKADVPEVDKKIVEDTKKVVVGDYEIGDTVKFELSGTLPDNYDDYKWYKYVFHDTLSAGLTLDANSFVIKVDDTTITMGYQVVTENLTDGCTFEVRFADLKTVEGVTKDSTITVEYTATLNEKAVINQANTNKVKLEFANNPNYTTDADNDDKPDGDIPTGMTPEKTVEVFTTEVHIEKVDQNKKPLTGAEFQITGTTINKVVVKYVEFTESEAGSYYLLKDGTYTETAPTDDNAELYADTTKKYVKAEKTEVQTKTESVDVKKLVGADGKLTFTGLGEGEYTIKETMTPAGYNTVADITLKVDFDETNKEFSYTWSGGAAGNTATIQVINVAGTQLPETGGMGTTLIYAVGALLVAGAVIVMISKKRAAAK